MFTSLPKGDLYFTLGSAFGLTGQDGATIGVLILALLVLILPPVMLSWLKKRRKKAGEDNVGQPPEKM